MKHLILILMLCGFCCGDIIMDETGDKIIWPDGEMEFQLSFVRVGGVRFGVVDGDNAITFLERLIFTSGGPFDLDEIIATNTGGFVISGTSGVTVLSSGGPLNLFANDDIVINPQGFATEIVGDLSVTNRLFVNNNEVGGSIRLFGSNTDELLVAAQFTNVVQETDGVPFELRLTGTFTDGSDADYAIEIDGTDPDTFKWSKDTIEQATGVTAPDTFTTLDAGIQTAFLNSGSDIFVLGDQWSFTAVASPTAILNVDTVTPLVTIDALSVTTTTSLGGALDMNGNDITDTGNIIPVDGTKTLGSNANLWDDIWLNGRIGVISPGFYLDIDISNSKFNFVSNATDVVLQLDGSGANTGTFTFESDNDIFKIGAQSFSVDDVLVVDAVNDTINGTFIRGDNTTNTLFVGTDSFGGLPGGITQAQNDGLRNIGVGLESGFNNDFSGGGSDGTDNIYVGYRAGKGAAGGSTGRINVAIGAFAMQDITSGFQNVALGASAMANLMSGNGNFALGTSSLLDLTSGNINIAIGTSVLANITNGVANIAIGRQAGTNLGPGSSRKNNVFIGDRSGLAATAGASNIFLGFHSGRFQATPTSVLLIDNQDRTNAATELTNSIIYGVMNADGVDDASLQSLTFNIGSLTLNPGTDTDMVVNFTGTTNSGVLTWMEDEDYFKYSDEILMDSAEKLFFRDTAIGIYSQADTFLDLFADGGIRFGDSSAGAPTNYTNFADGLQTMVGTARVLRSVDFEPEAVKKGGVGPGDSDEDGFPIHDYSAASDESVFIHWEIPHSYASAGEIHLHVEYFVDTAPVGASTVTWGVEYKKLSIGDNFDFGAGTTTIIVNDALTTGTPANDKQIHSSDEIHLVTTGFEPMDVVLIRIFRDADASEVGATDDFGSDARVFNYHLMHLSDKLGQGS
ncbi:MAG TPA: hypothetical protein ENI05_03970 [Porticoccus sp.]|nr:hypothetical protein [Porticoccus sp.]